MGSLSPYVPAPVLSARPLPFAPICWVGPAEPRFCQKRPCLNCLWITLLAVAEGAGPGRGRDWLVTASVGEGREAGLPAGSPAPGMSGLHRPILFCPGSEAALDDLCAAETEAEDPEMDCG